MLRPGCQSLSMYSWFEFMRAIQSPWALAPQAITEALLLKRTMVIGSHPTLFHYSPSRNHSVFGSRQIRRKIVAKRQESAPPANLRRPPPSAPELHFLLSVNALRGPSSTLLVIRLPISPS